jgi:signal transduction histidine kinase
MKHHVRDPLRDTTGKLVDNGRVSNASQDPRWPRLLGLAVHEFRTPLTVVAGYIRMLLKDRAGPVTVQQRKLLEEAEKSCGRLSALLSEMSDLANLESQTATLNRSAISLGSVLNETVEAVPALPDRDISVTVSMSDPEARVEADAVRLTTAFTSLVTGLRRELVSSTALLVSQRTRVVDGRRVSWIVMGDDGQSATLADADPSGLAIFDEWRGGCGLSLAVARRIINAHGGSTWSPADGGKAAAVVALPEL